MFCQTDTTETTPTPRRATRTVAQAGLSTARGRRYQRRAAVRSSRQRADICPLSAASSRSLTTFVTAVSVLLTSRSMIFASKHPCLRLLSLYGDHTPDITMTPDDVKFRWFAALLPTLSVTHIMPVLVLLSVVGVGMQQCMI